MRKQTKPTSKPADVIRPWEVNENRVATDGKEDLPQLPKEDYQTLVRRLQAEGPSRGGMGQPHFGPLRQLSRKYGGRKVFHCHLNKGKPTYVAVWVEYDKTKRQILMVYVGTHEGAPY